MMVSVKRALLYGLVVWVVPFIVAFMIYPIHESWRALFESIMPVVITATVVPLGLLYLRHACENLVREAVVLGIVWFVISIAIDLVMFSRGPMQMGLGEYMGDIGITYLMIPMITVGLGFASSRGLVDRGAA